MEGKEVEKTDAGQRPEGIVKFDNVTFAYKAGENVLKDISFEARKGETVALGRPYRLGQKLHHQPAARFL